MRPKDIGTRFETAVVNYLRLNGFGQAERRALAGEYDRGDITGTPGIAWECKAGARAHTASDLVIGTWLEETDRERWNASAAVGVLVVSRSGFGALRTGSSWAIMRADALGLRELGDRPMRMHLSTCVRWLRSYGYGDPLDANEQNA
jgi:hypothetical protein